MSIQDGGADSRGIRIGTVESANRVFLAPMSGVTDVAFRRLAHRFGAGLVVSEMVACEQLAEGHPETRLRSEGIAGAPHVVQLAGREARWMAEGARLAEAAGADVIDINMGCPAKKVTSGYSGSALMRDLDHALTLVEATVGAVSVPVTLKMRLGWDHDSLNAPELAARAEAAGIAMITVHGRTRCQFYKGQADWDAIRAVRERISVPLVANGDCTSVEDAREMMDRSGADAVMVGRAAYGRPWLPGAIAAGLDGLPAPVVPSGAELGELVCEHIEMMRELYGSQKGLRLARKHIAWYLDAGAPGVPGPMRQKILTSEDAGFVTAGVRACFAGGAETAFSLEAAA
ncbi:tRNA dihydrouridine synthase DusB [Stappia indica]|uniref:tRNA-dihydrouridine synthase n=1 Tax=Stappia indica TaxID=538381 RepID=A0A857C2U7_9HYPH|nr:tRNA dihydrouridine synthase DusB [Stappia indica]QGZ33283.1 tRNA dihydrouridine synthase DusB [Stappia indica]